MPLTSHWYHVEDPSLRSHPGFIIFRKYSMLTAGPSRKGGKPIRNVYLYHCSTTTEKPSYFTLVVPPEIGLQNIIGTNYVDGYRIVVFADQQRYPIVVEVNENEIFADAVAANVESLDHILSSSTAIYTVTREFWLTFSLYLDEFPKPIAGAKTFDALIDQSIVPTYEKVEKLTTREMLDRCEALSPFGK